MRNIRFVPIVLSILFVFPFVAFAVGSGGGGGGGGSPSCSSDTFDCSSWSACTLAGTQSRTCSKTNDCATVNDPEPGTTQSCTPECTEDTWECSGWSPCFSNGTQSRKCSKTKDCSLTDTPSPITSQVCKPACQKDVWSCGAFGSCFAEGKQSRVCSMTFDCENDNAASPSESQSCTPECTEDTWNCKPYGACDVRGNQSRVCSMTKDCPGVVTNKPVTATRCDHVQCNQKTMRDCVYCRLNLAPEGVKRDNEIEFLPEACRPFSGHDREECLEYYKDYWPCWKEKTFGGLISCAKDVLKLGKDDLKTQKTACGSDKECLEELKEHSYHLIVFRFYDLEQRAENWILEGVSMEKTADFETTVIENKIAFLKATTSQERKAVIEKMRADWNAHAAYARTILKR